MNHVLIAFQADEERTEQMALAVGVGAVEGEALIRLRRLAAPGTAELAHRGYGKLQEADLVWASTIVVGLESPFWNAGDLEQLLSLLGSADSGELAGRHAWTFGLEGLFQGLTEAQIFVESLLETAGLVIWPSKAMQVTTGTDPIEQMKEAGRISAKLNRPE